jgi:hypothetical protein
MRNRFVLVGGIAAVLASTVLAAPPEPPAPGGPNPQEPRGPRQAPKFEDMDKNGDGYIDQQEAGERWKRLQRLDKDGDGKVSREEWDNRQPPRGPRPGGPGPAPSMA